MIRFTIVQLILDIGWLPTSSRIRMRAFDYYHSYIYRTCVRCRLDFTWHMSACATHNPTEVGL